ncbi:MAG: C1 family peptidase [Actinobacteria bacterium]|nr:C1 family peptidase [Actinomycetota bacterium]
MSGGRRIQSYGWLPDLPDHRDLLYAPPPVAQRRLPRAASLQDAMPPVFEQGALGSCTGQAIAAADQFEAERQGEGFGTPSRLFIYYGEREIEGSVDRDSGAMIRDGFKVLARDGAPPETDWPYDISRFAERPPENAYADARLHRAVSYRRLPQTATALRTCLAEGYPFVFGFTVYESFESDGVAATGRVEMPAPSEGVLGGHAVVAVGYDDSEQRFTVRNSWGQAWAAGGYFTMPYAYLLDASLASDLWTLRTLS